MPRFLHRLSVSFLVCAALAVADCSSLPSTSATVDGQASVDGIIVSIDTRPWTYDGPAVIELDTRTHGRLKVKLPARWNLCRAVAVDVEALAVGMPVTAVGTLGAGELVVCEREEHRLVPADRGRALTGAIHESALASAHVHGGEPHADHS